MSSTIHSGLSARNRVRPITLGAVLRSKGPEWSARYLQRRYGIRRRHADLVVAMLGVRCGR